MFAIGILPAFLLLYVRRWVDEPALWIAANQGRQDARKRLAAGGLSQQDRELAQFTMTRVLSDSELRRRVGLLFLMSIITLAIRNECNSDLTLVGPSSVIWRG
jgi:hypothetical protein